MFTLLQIKYTYIQYMTKLYGYSYGDENRNGTNDARIEKYDFFQLHNHFLVNFLVFGGIKVSISYSSDTTHDALPETLIKRKILWLPAPCCNS